MHSIAQTLKCRDLNVRAALIYIGLNAITTRELPNYVDCTVHQSGTIKLVN